MNVVLFDIDHTIMASPSGANDRASRRMFKDIFGVDTSEDAVEKVGMTEWGLIETVLDRAGANPIPVEGTTHTIPDKAYQYWAQALAEELKQAEPATLLPGIWEMLVALADEPDIKLGLLTGNSYWRSEVKLAAVGVDEFFRDRPGKLVGAFGNEARTRDGLLAFARDRLVFDNDTMTIVDDSLLGAKMLVGTDVYGLFVATGHATMDELKKHQQVVVPDLGEDRWQKAVDFLKAISQKPST